MSKFDMLADNGEEPATFLDVGGCATTDSGSETVETALKIARGYWRNLGQPSKTKFIGRHKGYHGVNFGGVSVGGIGFNRKLFGQSVDSDHIPHTILEENKFELLKFPKIKFRQGSLKKVRGQEIVHFEVEAALKPSSKKKRNKKS